MPNLLKIEDLIQSLSNEKDRELCRAIFNKITKKKHNHESPQKNKDRTLTKCIGSFNEGANPDVLSKLEEFLSEKIKLEELPKKEEYQKYYKYYIENFLPVLKVAIMESKALAELPVFNKEIEQSQGPKTRKGEIVGIILGITNKIGSQDHPSSTIENQNGRRNSQASNHSVETPELSDSNNLDSGISSLVPNEENLKSSVSSRRGSVSSTSSSAEKNSDSQEETGDQMQPVQIVEEEPQVSSQCLRSREKENMDPNDQVTQVTGSQTNTIQTEEKKEGVVPKKQSVPDNNNNNKNVPPEKQPNNRNLHSALVAGCTVLAIGCIVAGAMTASAGLFAMAAVFAMAAAAELHSNFLSSELTSINVSPLVDDKQLGKN
ncbi:hypothetical protein [Candidatus Wolbachia massiliensis]|uniref:Ankyrin repeat domain protein n=1 Tax=Candidatus Wolbachia massiliensis TaxID=1845000 RepID=A0A7M3U2E7_9RICK|nr:hypothetical protein [Candidatus Wolbachia massiliensis]QOD38582.1 hypothetical protein ID128_01725 [Candidatus Wolbachia massiliensis]